MELGFETKSLRTTCENESQAKFELGITVAEILKRRLADLRAATSVKDLVAGRPRILDGTGLQQMAVDLCNGHSIVFTANHTDNPLTESGNLDWMKVSRVKIMRIGRDNG